MVIGRGAPALNNPTGASLVNPPNPLQQQVFRSGEYRGNRFFRLIFLQLYHIWNICGYKRDFKVV